jgi:hypothetical protein
MKDMLKDAQVGDVFEDERGDETALDGIEPEDNGIPPMPYVMSNGYAYTVDGEAWGLSDTVPVSRLVKKINK